MIFKIKLEDKAALLNRMEKADDELSSNQIKDNRAEGYFELTVNDPKQLEIVKSILNKSPKINTIKEMKKSLTKNELKEMIRQELNEKKKVEDKKKKLNEMSIAGIDLNQLFQMADHELGVFLSGVAALATVGGLAIKAAVSDFRERQKAGEIKSKDDIIDVVKDNAK
jgi:hypothetical protein